MIKRTTLSDSLKMSLIGGEIDSNYFSKPNILLASLNTVAA